MIYNMPKKLWQELYRMLRDSRVHVEGSSAYLVDNWLIKEYGLFSIEDSSEFLVDKWLIKEYGLFSIEYNAVGFYKYRATYDEKLLEFILRWT